MKTIKDYYLTISKFYLKFKLWRHTLFMCRYRLKVQVLRSEEEVYIAQVSKGFGWFNLTKESNTEVDIPSRYGLYSYKEQVVTYITAKFTDKGEAMDFLADKILKEDARIAAKVAYVRYINDPREEK